MVLGKKELIAITYWMYSWGSQIILTQYGKILGNHGNCCHKNWQNLPSTCIINFLLQIYIVDMYKSTASKINFKSRGTVDHPRNKYYWLFNIL